MGYVENVQAQWDDWEIERKWGAACRNEMVKFWSRTRFDVFWTQTFRGRTSEWGARAKWLSFLADINLHLDLSLALWVVEPHANSDSTHVHALLSTRLPLSPTKYSREWRHWKESAWKRVGKAFVIQTHQHTPTWYVLKYLMKDPRTDRDFMTPTPKPREKLWGVWTPKDSDGTIHGVKGRKKHD